MSSPRRLAVGVSGASGMIYAHTLLKALSRSEIETHLVISQAARRTLACETDWTAEDFHALAHIVHEAGNVGASIASGSFETLGMLIVPCSVKTMSEIAHGVTSSLLTRAADVALKERRRLVLAVRETPLHLGHLRTMTALTEMGAIVAPPLPAMYARPKSVQELVEHSVGRWLDLFGISNALTARWNGSDACKSAGEAGNAGGRI
jgi:4-hydroxy-3-polyprenylbenzoate decarboxylase